MIRKNEHHPNVIQWIDGDLKNNALSNLRFVNVYDALRQSLVTDAAAYYTQSQMKAMKTDVDNAAAVVESIDMAMKEYIQPDGGVIMSPDDVKGMKKVVQAEFLKYIREQQDAAKEKKKKKSK